MTRRNPATEKDLRELLQVAADAAEELGHKTLAEQLRRQNISAPERVVPTIELIQHIPDHGPEDLDDPELEEELWRRLEAGDEWAWCDVEVRATWGTLEATDYLGECSYENQRDFIQHSGYYEDMVREVVHELNRQREENARAFQGVVFVPPAGITDDDDR